MRRRALIIGGVLSLGVLSWLIATSPAGTTDDILFPDPLRRTEFRLAALMSRVTEAEGVGGTVEQVLDSLFAKRPGADRFLNDAWGNRLHYSIRRDSVLLYSRGVDGLLDTADDLWLLRHDQGDVWGQGSRPPPFS